MFSNPMFRETRDPPFMVSDLQEDPKASMVHRVIVSVFLWAI